MNTMSQTNLDPWDVAGGPSPPLASPTRNRYFYGKLLDARHLELEQRYFLEQSRQINRMGLGFGVLCGLGLELAGDGTKLILYPGVAIDGLGREIVVPTPVCIDPAATDKTGGEHVIPRDPKAGVTVCLCYHECETEPAPALVSECEVRERCVNGLVCERFRIHLQPGLPDYPPYLGATGLLGILKRRLAVLERESAAGGPDPAAPVAPPSPHDPPSPQLAGVAGLGSHVSGFPASAGTFADPALTELLSCAAPRDDCVVLGTLTLPAEGADKPILDTFTYRRTIMSNDALFELILGLTALVQRCCRSVEPTTSTVTVTGDKQSTKAKSLLDKEIVVTVTDANDKPVADAPVTFEVTSALGGSFEPASTTTKPSGDASSKWRLGARGPQTARVTVGDQTVDLTATAV